MVSIYRRSPLQVTNQVESPSDSKGAQKAQKPGTNVNPP